MLLPNFLSYSRKIGYRRRWIATILALQLLAVLFEGIGIGMVLPILQFINSGGDTEALVAGSHLWQWFVDAAGMIGVPLNLVSLLAGAFAAIVMRQIFMYARDVFTAAVQFELQRRVRDIGFDRFVRANLGYHDRIRAGDFVNELTTELQMAVGAMTSAANFLGSVLLGLGYLTLAAMLSRGLTVVAVIVLAIAAMILLRLMQRMRELGKQVTQANQQMSSFLVERLKSVRLVKLSGVEEAEKSVLAERTREQRDRLLDRRRMLALLSVVIEPIVLAMAFSLLYVSVTVLALPFERIMVFFLILVRLVPIMKEAMLLRQGYIANIASVEVIVDRLDGLAIARDPDGGTRRLNTLEKGVTFDDVTFSYGEPGCSDSDRPPALNGLSLFIPAHRMTALVGPSGAGKSTLVDLLPGLRKPQTGQILFDGISQSEFESSSLRNAISFAPQMPQMFNVSVAEHIRYGWRGARMDDIHIAAQLAQASKFIEALPNGYDTLLGEGGSHLSGGQRQRIDLARAVVRQAPILILDEPTSNLDAEAEAQFLIALERIRKETNTTLIIIAHRLSTIASADQIVVMENGRISDAGRHDELIARNDWYRTAFETQQLNREIELEPN